ncbi:MAG: hypothetical protein QOG42_646 [Solirubrobacteraceae bacterium]|nr:hypothetical protein [Solirubrobacteraceae bacterium]
MSWFKTNSKAPPVMYVSGPQRLLVGAALVLMSAIVCTALVGVWPAVSKNTVDTPTVSVDAATAKANDAAATSQTTTTGKGATTPDATGAAKAATEAAQAAAASAQQARDSGKAGSAQQTASKIPLLLGAWHPAVSGDAALFVLVIIMSLLGSLVYVTTSFALHSSQRNLTVSYLWWYPMRFIGGTGLALLIYTALRGGLFSGDFTTEEVNPYGIAAAAGLTGMFSKQATGKLAQLFDVAFHIAPAGAPPKIDALDPSQVPTGSGPTAIKVTGSGFVEGTTAVADDTHLDVTYASGSELSVVLPPQLLEHAHVINVVVDNPDPTTGKSAPAKVKVVDGPGAHADAAPGPDAGAGTAAPTTAAANPPSGQAPATDPQASGDPTTKRRGAT